MPKGLMQPVPTAKISDKEGNPTPIYVAFLNTIRRLLSVAPEVFQGSGPPLFVPKKVGDIYINTNNNNIFMAVSVISSDSWVKIS